MSAVNLRELLSQPSDQFIAPKPLPEGHFIAMIKGTEYGQSRLKKTHYVRFLLSIKEAGDDITPDMLEGVTYEGRELKRDFYITPNALYRLTSQLDDILGAQPGVSFDQRISECHGQEVLVQVTQRLSDDGKETFNDIGTIIAHSAT
jgi:hypothetical protein